MITKIITWYLASVVVFYIIRSIYLLYENYKEAKREAINLEKSILDGSRCWGTHYYGLENEGTSVIIDALLWLPIVSLALILYMIRISRQMSYFDFSYEGKFGSYMFKRMKKKVVEENKTLILTHPEEHIRSLIKEIQVEDKESW